MNTVLDVPALEFEIHKLRAQLKERRRRQRMTEKMMQEARDARDQLREKVRLLRAALEPLARFAEVERGVGDLLYARTLHTAGSVVFAELRASDARQARFVLNNCVDNFGK